MNENCTIPFWLVIFFALLCSQLGAHPSPDKTLSWGLVGSKEDDSIRAIKEGAPVEGRDRFGTTRLLEAVRRSQYRVVVALLEAGAKIKATNDSGESALTLTVQRKGDAKIATLLIEHEADVNHANEEGQTPLTLAAADNRADLVELFTKAGASPDSATQNKYRVTPLGSAAGFGNVEAVQALLKAGATVEKTDANGCTPLAGAVDFEHTEVMKLLLQAGADPNQQHPGGKPLVLDCIQNHKRKALAALVAGKADLSFDYENQTPVICALSFDLDALPIVLRAKPDLNQKVKQYVIAHVSLPPGSLPPKNYVERTALMMAVENNKPALVKTLLESGADPKIRDDTGYNAADLAHEHNYTDIARLLETSEGQSGTH